MGLIGRNTRRLEATQKVEGLLKYIDDYPFEGLYGEVVRSTIAYGEIESIEYDQAFDFSDITIVTYKDIENQNIYQIIHDDQPFLASKVVKFIGEPILLLATSCKKRLKEATKHITIHYKEYKPSLDIQTSLNQEVLIFGEDNLFHRIQINKGKKPKDKALKRIKASMSTLHQEHIYVEPQGVIARYQGGQIKIEGSMQCPFYVEGALEAASGKKIEVEQSPTGGGFGGKEDYPSLVAVYAYLLCYKAKQDIKLIYERDEDIAYSTKRHPSFSTYEAKVSKEGSIKSLKIDFILDGGAYSTLSPVVLSRAVLHLAGFYDIDYIQVDAKAVATNTPPNSAFRGFGAPQALFGIERFMDICAKRLGISPIKIRKINLPHQDTLSITKAKVRQYERYNNIFKYAIKDSGFKVKRANKKPNRGVGIALFMHGGGFTGDGEAFLDSKVRLVLRKNGKVEIQIASVEMGQGSVTALRQMVAHTLKLPIEYIDYRIPNTRYCANSGPTVASRTVMIVGRLLQEASQKLIKSIGAYDSIEEYQSRVKAYQGKRKFGARYQKPKDIIWDEDKFEGDGYEGYSYGCYIAEVEIDPVDYSVHVVSFKAYNDIGRVINPQMATGQVEGGVVQGIGYSLYEKLAYEKGKILNANLANYTLPLASDIGSLKAKFIQSNHAPSGLGELPMDGVGAAIANAISDALDVDFNHLPIQSQSIMEKVCN
ncbi:MAG: xanthine dehydrogenase family protein molybdopterin-binding subunit [Campylobacterota bacterium]|nr:xanthine dehydrogenase family protein molybdopterin-binding subunit [Campylobacterota bacterium]